MTSFDKQMHRKSLVDFRLGKPMLGVADNSVWRSAERGSRSRN